MISKLFVFRHAETTDNRRQIFSGWRDPKLTSKGLEQAQEVAEQLRQEEINYAFTSHLKRARKTLEIVLEMHLDVPVFIDDRLIERCYGLLQGRSKRKVAEERPEWFTQVHRGYDFPPPEGESLKMVEKRTLPFLAQLETWLGRNRGNVAISCHGNSLRPIRRVFEHLSLRQMLKIENPQDHAMVYALHVHSVKVKSSRKRIAKSDWQSIIVPKQVKLASNQRNPLKRYY
jgi:2,3-bisphosphoglycerate-dependent phosphoglycerate mutase